MQYHTNTIQYLTFPTRSSIFIQAINDDHYLTIYYIFARILYLFIYLFFVQSFDYNFCESAWESEHENINDQHWSANQNNNNSNQNPVVVRFIRCQQSISVEYRVVIKTWNHLFWTFGSATHWNRKFSVKQIVDSFMYTKFQN